MELGVLVESEEELTWDSWRGVLGAAESLGYESVWISDHLSSPWAPQRHGIEAWSALAIAAAETRRVRLGPLVSPITFREPALVARMAESLDTLSGGRFVLGLGLGWNVDEHRAFGIDFPSVQQRVDRLSQGIERIRGMLGERRVPILVGGMGERATLPIVARYADEWNLTTASPEVYRARKETLARLCREVGRDPSSIKHSVALGLLIGRDAAELRQRSRRMQEAVEPLAGVDVGDVPAAARGMGWVVGTPREVLDQLQSLSREGLGRAILGHYLQDDVAALELVATEVLPALK